MDKIIVICGPTASGKTDLGINLCNRIDGEIVSCDSMQIYKELEIGTAKPTEEERSMAVHHLVDFVDPTRRYSVAEYKKDAERVIDDIISRGKTPVLVGGTGLYLNSLLYNINYKEDNVDLEYRKQLEKRDVSELYNEAKRIDPVAIEKISENDKKRIMRILEIYKSTGRTKTELEIESREAKKYDFKVFVLSMDREKLYEKINKRVDIMIEKGLVNEVEGIIKKYDKMPTAIQGIGYKEVVEYLNKEISYEDMIEKIKQETRRYAKRQITWFKSYKDAIWLDSLNSNNVDIIMEEISEETKQAQ